MKKINLLILLIAVISLTTNAQRTGKAKGADYSFLKKEKALNVTFDYDGMTVGKNMTEEEYVAKKVAEKNAKKKGTGDTWKKAWEKGKLSVYEPDFKKLFRKYMAKTGIKITEGDDARLTLIVKITRIEPGYNIGISAKEAVIDVELIFVETANPDNIILQVVMTGMKGSNTFTVSDRIRQAFAVTGKRLAAYIKKSFK